jgi:hypothetical protein
MGKSFTSAAAFRTSLEARLKQLSAQSGAPLNSLRLKVVIERLLARLFRTSDPPWLLKGGYAMELRYRPRARTTKDIDLSVKSSLEALIQRLRRVRDELQAAADTDLGDFFKFQIGEATSEVQGAPEGGARFSVNAIVAGRTFAKFHIDVGFGDPMDFIPEELTGEDFLAFAGVPPAKVLAIPKAQQFAEKLHAYTLPWTDRPNTRTKDLVDLVILVTVDPPNHDAIEAAVAQTFSVRATHDVPESLPGPAEEWRAVYAEMAAEAELNPRGMDEGFQILQRYWDELNL